MRWYAQDEVNKEESEHNEVDGMKKGADNFHRWVDVYLKERLMICNEEDIDGQAMGDNRWGAGSRLNRDKIVSDILMDGRIDRQTLCNGKHCAFHSVAQLKKYTEC